MSLSIAFLADIGQYGAAGGSAGGSSFDGGHCFARTFTAESEVQTD
jgi:hypothetical protein